ncbi:MAG: signal recognition particle protein, partial [Candidatus Dadabacteria bacterium]|nr:signal recognition particle protein [Candidatus Dadabacteria bacterium]
GTSPLRVPAEISRPAAIELLKVRGEKIDGSVYDTVAGSDPVDVCADAVSASAKHGADAVIIDTAGRLHLDRELMDELGSIKKKVNPHEILLVADSMTGQDAVNVSQSFDDAVDLDGVILTKMDADARGGAALSIKATTGKPIKFFGTGEKADALEVFHPERIASRILGMGDVLSLIEKAEDAFEEERTKKLAERISKKQFSLEDYRESILAMSKLGSIESIAHMVPGMKKVTDNPEAIAKAEDEIKKSLAIINSMTMSERRNHAILNGSRRKRIAKGSGTTVPDVNRMVKNYIQMRNMMKNMGKMGKLAKRMTKFR